MQKWNRVNYQPNLPLYKGRERVTASREHLEVSKNAAKEGMVLLKNDGNLLPLKRGSRVVLFGKGTFDYVKGGGGSGDVTVSHSINLYDGFKKYPEMINVYDETAKFYKNYVEKEYSNGNAPGMIEEPTLPDDILNTAKNYADIAIISISRFSGEAWDRKIEGVKCRSSRKEDWVTPMQERADVLFPRGDFYLTDEETEMVSKVKKAFEKVVVVLNVGGVVDTEWIKNDQNICSCLLAWQGGMEGGLAEAELLMGMGYPSGKLADTFAKRIEDYPSTEGFYASDDYVEYTEDIYVGYRYFETIPGAREKVNYPFGYGLSYTNFDIDNLELETRIDGTGDVIVRCDVTNIGTHTGKEVIQVYYSAPQGILGKSRMALGGYKKTRELDPGETERIEISYPVTYMASYDDAGKVAKSSYILEQGEYFIYVGNSVEDVIEAGALELDENVLVERLSEKLKPNKLKKRMRPDGSFEPLETYDQAEKSKNDSRDNECSAEIDGTVGYAPAYRAVPRQKLWDENGKPKFIDVAEGRISLDEFVSKLPDKILAELLGGQPNTGVANCYGIGNLPEYGVPNAMTADGPAGLRILPEVGVCTTAFPSATLLACTWNPEITYKVGVAAGEEVKENNLAVWLAPAVNIHRNPLCGRNFEYYSEDPVLAGNQASALVMGVQSNHIGVSLKHFALNNKESNRFHSDSRVSERAAREIYLKPFEIVVKESDPWTVMSSYNLINGVRASENLDLLTGILKGEWGYDGMVTTDWWNYATHYKEVMAGNDIKMGTGYPEQLICAVQEGLINRKNLENSAKRVLAMILKLD